MQSARYRSALARKVFTCDRLTLTLAGDLSEAFAAQAVAAWPTQTGGRETSDARQEAKDARRETLDARHKTPGAISEGYEADGTVGFSTMAAMLPPGQRFSGAHLVAARIVSLDYLWQEIRVKGGAYGGGLTAFAQALTALSTNASTCVFAKRPLLEPCKLAAIRQISPQK